MNIKSLLLGSAAALAVVSGAQAADAVVAAEPEPMEYVRVCDAYGTGFFYIPGTETCLKIGGQLRYEKRFSDGGTQKFDRDGLPMFRTRADGTLKLDADGNPIAKNTKDSYDNHTRARLRIDARNDSEWGTVYSWIQIQADSVNNGENIYGDGNNSYLRAYYYFGIGGLEFGNYDSQWAKFMGYGGRTDDGGVYTSDWNYPDSRQYVSYTADFGNFKAFVSLDNDADEFYKPEDHDGDGVAGPRGRQYLPDISAGVSGTFGDYSAAAAIGYDESDESFAIKKVVRGDIGMFGFTAMGLYSDSDENIYFAYDGFSALIGLSAKVTDTVTIAKDIQWFDNGDWRLVGDVNWEVATGFSVLVEGVYFNPDEGDDSTSGFLRFQRNF
ncbi:porin [Rhizobium sp. LjRoot254]|uniref:porin n=1 Tax=Rhizobium sp. LjRoot254 TaxID=3342297 RepID=UPI003ECEC366